MLCNKNKTLSLTIFVFIFVPFFTTTFAQSSIDINVVAVLEQGELSINSPNMVLFDDVSVAVENQNTTGLISNLSVVDTRGSGLGWTVSMSSTNFTSKKETIVLSGNNANVSFAGNYDGLHGVLDPLGSFMVEITNGGGLGESLFKWVDPSGNEIVDVVTATSVSLSNGISINFNDVNYTLGDKWMILVDVLPYTALTVDPQNINNNSGSLTGVSSGLSALLSGDGISSNPFLLMKADRFYGLGSYYQSVNFNLLIHSNSLSGVFIAQANISIV